MRYLKKKIVTVTLYLQICRNGCFWSKQKQFFFSPHNGVRSWLDYPESLRFQVFSLFLICRDRTRCTTKRRRQEKNVPSLFLIRRDRTRCTEKSIRNQGRQQSETKTKRSNNKLIKYERFNKKQIRHCNIIPSDLPK